MFRQLVLVNLICCLWIAACSSPASEGEIADVQSDDTEQIEETVDPAVSLAEGMAFLNEQREVVGLDALAEDAELTSGCLAHVRYMAAHGKLTHNEDIQSAWYTNHGFKAGTNSLISGPIASMKLASQFWILAPYHRLALLDPGVTNVGFAFESNLACLDILSAFEEQPGHAPVAYPAANQKNVPLAFKNYEGLSPLPSEYVEPTGFIISLLFAPDTFVAQDFEGNLVITETAQPLTTYLRAPNDPTDKYAKYQGNAVTLVPEQPLAPNTTYTVSLKGSVNEEPFEQSWDFTTGPPPGAETVAP